MMQWHVVVVGCAWNGSGGEGKKIGWKSKGKKRWGKKKKWWNGKGGNWAWHTIYRWLAIVETTTDDGEVCSWWVEEWKEKKERMGKRESDKVRRERKWWK